MKKVLSFLLVLAVIASMGLAYFSVSAEGEPSLILNKTVVRAEAGAISLYAKINGAVTYETWLGIFAEADLDPNQTDTKTLYSGKNSGWVYAQNVKNTAADPLDKNVIPEDGSIVNLSTNAFISSKELKAGKYIAIMFKDDNLSGQTNGFEPLAQAEFEVVIASDTASSSSVTSIANPLGMLWFQGPDAEYAQTFSAEAPIQGVNIPAWTPTPGKQDADVYVYPYDTDVTTSVEGEAVYSAVRTFTQGDTNLIKFDKPLPAGDYVLRIVGKYETGVSSLVLLVAPMDQGDVEYLERGTNLAGDFPSVKAGCVSLTIFTAKADAAEEVLNPAYGDQPVVDPDPEQPEKPQEPAETGDSTFLAALTAAVLSVAALTVIAKKRNAVR